MLPSLPSFRRPLLAAALLFGLTPGFAAPFQAAKVAAPTAKPAPSTTTADADKLDLNTATPSQLKSLPGIGDAYAKRIVDGRPYTAKNQLTTRGILPENAYNGIKEMIVARRPAKK